MSGNGLWKSKLLGDGETPEGRKMTECPVARSSTCETNSCMHCVTADSRYRGRGPPNDVGSSYSSNVAPGSSNVGGQSSQSGPPAKQSSDSSTRMRNGPVGAGAGKNASSKVQNGQ